MRARLLVALGLAALALPAQASAHGRAPVVALDYRLTLSPATRALPGVSLSVVDGDRDLSLRVASGTDVLVRGEVGEPMLRIDARGVWVDASSPTATSDGLISARRHGWVRVSGGDSIVWHDHRLIPPPRASAGPDGTFTIPVVLDGHLTAITGSFARVAAPALWPWLAAAAALAGAIATAARRGGGRLTVALGVAAGLAALAAVTSFAAPDAPGGSGGWLELAAAVVLGAVAGSLLLRLAARPRVRAAGIVGALAAAVSLSSLSVFRHGVVVSTLPAPLARLLCGVALECGVAAAVLSVLRIGGARSGARRSVPHIGLPTWAVRR